jgi:NADPH-dependent 2,4-dienoyl-CoA reductase/sulfur reductase-like enzyme
VDLRAKQVTDDTGQVYAFDRLLLATGASPVHLNGTDVVYFRTLDDYYRLRERAQRNKRFIVIGGGFIGSELAAALALQGCRVTMLFPEEGIGGRLFPRDLALFLNEYYRERGVEVVPNEKVVALTRGGRGMLQHAPTTIGTTIVGAGSKPAPTIAPSQSALRGGFQTRPNTWIPNLPLSSGQV